MNVRSLGRAAVGALGLAALPVNADASDPDHADTSGSRSQVSVALVAAYGAGAKYEDSEVNRYGLGLGVRAGVTFGAPQLYVGGSFVKFFGESAGGAEYYTNTLDAEVGYDFHVLRDDFVIRPQLGFGLAQTVSLVGDAHGYPIAFHWAPGVLAEARLRWVLVSAGGRYDMVPGDWVNAATVLGAVGAVF